MTDPASSIIFVTYRHQAGASFDRGYYADKHMSLVRQLWGPYGLESAEAFFPASSGSATIVVAELRFRDKAAMDASLGSPGTLEIMDDVKNFTDLPPIRFRTAPL